MKRTSLTIIFACCILALAAQDVIKVNFKGSKPTISDFVGAYLNDYVYNENDDDCLNEVRASAKQAWINYLNGKPQVKNTNLIVDNRNGYVVFEGIDEYEGDKDVVRVEMCYWNDADGKHKLFAYNVKCFRNGKYSPGQFDGLQFYRYNNATKKMTYYQMPGFDSSLYTEDGAYITYSLPRVGKDIVITYWYDNGTKKQKTLK
ncbi:MAG: hypothetical protein II559_00255, partial [Muribaculaceae bacterium]|nr:hypothetical protein [Muribaculaceae bacterium]